ncbi:MAG: hypothetical protein CSA33_06860 [Desulfobulbus propionicus]|nr:MAG: hypothetical protein CSA33_06860 [Desulfobulbus propionicus]
MPHAINHILTLEVRKEIAERYFGLRKTIEEDIQRYNEQLKAALNAMEMTVGMTLIRIYILLQHTKIIKEFNQLIGLNDDLFFDPYLVESATIRRRLFNGTDQTRGRGITKKQKFTNLLYTLYQQLLQAVEEYRRVRQHLMQEEETIAEEIKMFHRNNDLSAIIGFLRHLDSDPIHTGYMAGDLMKARDKKLAEKMYVQPPLQAEKVLPPIPAMPPCKEVKKLLAQLAKNAFTLTGRTHVGYLFKDLDMQRTDCL